MRTDAVAGPAKPQPSGAQNRAAPGFDRAMQEAAERADGVERTKPVDPGKPTGPQRYDPVPPPPPPPPPPQNDEPLGP